MKKKKRAHYILKKFCSGQCPTVTTFFTYISPLIRDTHLKTVAIEVVDSSTSRPLQDTDASHLEKFWVKHILHRNEGAMSAVLVMAYFHQWRERRRRIPVWRICLIITLYYAEHFPLVQRWRQRWRQRDSLMVTVPILETNLCPRDRSPSQLYYILIRGLESISVPVEKPVWYSSPCVNPSLSLSPLVEISH